MMTNEREDLDVLIAGGGVAGSAAAAALSQLGLNILIIEPAPSPGRRLAGELIHPPGIDGLCELGLMNADALPGMPVKGFAVYPFFEDRQPTILPYGEIRKPIRCGQAIEHNGLKEHLLETVQRFPGVRAWLGARVTQIKTAPGQPYTAIVSREGGDTEIRAKLIIGADGPMSQVRKMVGIGYETQRYSGMMGLEVEDTHLPNPGYGNIFLNPAGVSYAYGIGEGRARVMFEVLKDADAKESITAHLSLFPPAFCADIEQALSEGKPLAAANYCIIPEASVRANVALVGDARGCCHPLTASGITAAVKDALILRDALRETQLDFAAALRRYSLLCGRLQLTRRTLAEELRGAFLAQ
ncbi:MAG: NAD(P)/FAD-dependent oxidoreductase, partial [Methylococcaceae bacterium]|nr:NAD(P)/FAD-dependent oxidoreductase [Methylococcaceae bacterium]